MSVLCICIRIVFRLFSCSIFYVYASVGPCYIMSVRAVIDIDILLSIHTVFIVFLYVLMEVCIGSLNK